jgi:hypothetical protein
MKHLAFILLLGLSLVAYSGTGAEEQPSEGQGTIINTFLELPAYPGSRIIEHEEDDDGDSETGFESTDSLQQIYTFFHDFLTEAGWDRVDLEEDSDEIEADYVRDGVEFELELEHEGGNIYKLEIDIDD